MFKDISFSHAARKKVKVGIDKAVNAIKVTFGGQGRNVLIEKVDGYPVPTKDGVTVAKSIQLKDPIENMGAMIVREVASKTVDVSGDGTTCASVLTQKITSIGMDAIENGCNPMEMKKGMEEAVKAVVNSIQKLAIKDTSYATLKNIATVSANGDEEIGSIIAEALSKIGKDGEVEVEKSSNYETTISIVEGMPLNKGFLSPYFVNNQEKFKCELEKPLILLYDKKITSIKDFVPVLEQVSKAGRSLLIISDEVSEEVMRMLLVNKVQYGFNVCVIKHPTYGGSNKQVMEDIATLTNGTFITGEKGSSLSDVKLPHFGQAEKVIVTKDKTTIIGGYGHAESIKERCQSIKTQEEVAETDLERRKLRERYVRLSGGVGVIKIGGASESEISEKRDRVDDALHATKAAMEEGYVAGGGSTYLHIAQDDDISQLLSSLVKNRDQAIGASIVIEAIKEPFKQILKNAGVSSIEEQNYSNSFFYAVDKIFSRDDFKKLQDDTIDSGYGYGVDVKSLEVTDLLHKGIIDPAKVLRVALEHSVSVSSLFLTTESVISLLNEQ